MLSSLPPACNWSLLESKVLLFEPKYGIGFGIYKMDCMLASRS